jgi:methionine aminopeptidase
LGLDASPQNNPQNEWLLMLIHIDYTLSNPDTLTKYKSAAQISHKVLEAVTALCAAGEKIVTICERGDKLLEEEIAKVYRGKKIAKGEQMLAFLAR